jgi:hypothetical protein
MDPCNWCGGVGYIDRYTRKAAAAKDVAELLRTKLAELQKQPCLTCDGQPPFCKDAVCKPCEVRNDTGVTFGKRCTCGASWCETVDGSGDAYDC